MKCPKCNSKMKLREPRPNQNWTSFWGCSKFPKCKGTRPYVNVDNSRSFEKRELKSIDRPNPRQEKIFQAVQSLLDNQQYEGKSSLIVNAGPGTGKTTTEEHVVGMIKNSNPNAKIVYLVFNKHVEQEAQSKGLPARTTHSFYFEQYKNQFGKVKVDTDKVVKIVKSLIDWDTDEKHLISPVVQLVSKVKNTAAPTDNQTLEKLCERFNIELNGSANKIFHFVRETMNQNNQMTKVIDLDDMLYLTWKLNVEIEKYDWVLVDEAQDFNRLQIELAKRTLKDEGHILVVGDENQSMYGFRGADLEAMEKFGERFDAYELPLDITYRCAKVHVKLLNQLFPHLSLVAAEGNKKGKLDYVSNDKMLGEVQPGDLVLCRINAPLVGPAFNLIRRGVKAIIRGRDIGKNLISLMDKFEENRVNEMLDKLIAYKEAEVYKLLKLEKNSQAQSLEDKVDTILALSEGCTYTSEIVRKIEEVFSDKKEGVVFSSIHKAKGDEAENVYILHSELMPHPRAEKEWEKVQEMNILWVALSRAKEKLSFVGQGFYLEEEMTEQEEEELVDTISEESLAEIIPVRQNEL